MSQPLPSIALGLLRIMSGFLLMPHGAQKLFGFLADPDKAKPELFSQMGLAGVLEFFGGLLLLVGFMTRPVAFLLSGMMAVGYFQAHAGRGFWPLENKGELAVLYCFVSLFFAAAGGGSWSIDGCLGRGKTLSSS
jgi:putative oxidoreductase